MLRFPGGIMILAGCMGLGFWYRRQFLLRLKYLRILLGILEVLVSEIGYGKATLPECCRRIGERQLEPFRSGFLRIYERMQENRGDSFPTVFRECMEDCLKGLPVTDGDREDFMSCAAGQSFGDSRMQIRTVEQSMELLRVRVDQLERENTEKCRLAVGLGAMSGLLLVIILL